MRTLCILAAMLAMLAIPPFVSAQVGTAFSVQGRLADGSLPANASYTFRFTPYSSATDGPPLAVTFQTPPVAVSDGVFQVTVDFGSAVFIGQPVWLEIAVDGPGTSEFVTLSPRMRVTPAPYALHADNVAVGAVDAFALRDGAVTTPKLADAAVTRTKIAPAAVGAAEIDRTAVQRRIAAGCPVGQAVRSISEDGGVACEPTSPPGPWSESAGVAHRQGRVGIGTSTAAGLLTLESDSSLAASNAQLRISEVGNDFARLRMSGTQGEGRFWDIAGLTSASGASADLLNFYHSTAGDILSIFGADTAGASGVQVRNNLSVVGRTTIFDPETNTGPMVLRMTDATLSTASGGATRTLHTTNRAGQSWIVDATMSNPSLPFAADRYAVSHSGVTDAPVLSLSPESGGRIGVGIANPAATLHVDGGARIGALGGFPGSETRNVRVEPDGDLVSAPAVGHLAIGPESVVSERGNDELITRTGRVASLPATVVDDALMIPVNLPHNARPTQLTVWLRDDSSTVDLTVNLLGIRLGAPATQVAYVSGLRTSGASSTVQALTQTLGALAVANDLDYLVLEVRCPDWPGGTTGFLGARVTYEL